MKNDWSADNQPSITGLLDGLSAMLSLAKGEVQDALERRDWSAVAVLLRASQDIDRAYHRVVHARRTIMGV